jgi:hypothetical protein
MVQYEDLSRFFSCLQLITIFMFSKRELSSNQSIKLVVLNILGLPDWYTGINLQLKIQAKYMGWKIENRTATAYIL